MANEDNDRARLAALRADPLLADVPEDATLEEIRTLAAFETGQALKVGVLRFDGERIGAAGHKPVHPRARERGVRDRADTAPRARGRHGAPVQARARQAGRTPSRRQPWPSRHQLVRVFPAARPFLPPRHDRHQTSLAGTQAARRTLTPSAAAVRSLPTPNPPPPPSTTQALHLAALLAGVCREATGARRRPRA